MTWSDKLGGILGEILVGRFAQQMKRENPRKFRPNFLPILRPDFRPSHKIGNAKNANGVGRI